MRRWPAVAPAVDAADAELTAKGLPDNEAGNPLTSAALGAALDQHAALTKRWRAISAGAIDIAAPQIARALEAMGTPGSLAFATFTSDIERATWSRRWTRYTTPRNAPAA